jgi:hypothetical protein
VIESRGSRPVNDYTLIFTFPANLTGLGGASVTGHNPTNGTGTVNGTSIGSLPNQNQLTVNLTNVSTGQYLTVTLTGVTDVAGNSGNVISPKIGIDGNDLSDTQTQTRTALPSPP